MKLCNNVEFFFFKDKEGEILKYYCIVLFFYKFLDYLIESNREFFIVFCIFGGDG